MSLKKQALSLATALLLVGVAAPVVPAAASSSAGPKPGSAYFCKLHPNSATCRKHKHHGHTGGQAAAAAALAKVKACLAANGGNRAACAAQIAAAKAAFAAAGIPAPSILSQTGGGGMAAVVTGSAASAPQAGNQAAVSSLAGKTTLSSPTSKTVTSLPRTGGGNGGSPMGNVFLALLALVATLIGFGIRKL